MRHRTGWKGIQMQAVLLMLIGILMATTLTVSAAKVSGTVNASSIKDGTLTLTGDTTLQMDTDLVLSQITGAYELYIEGNGKLTVTGDVHVGSLWATDAPMEVSGSITGDDTVCILSDYLYVYGGVDAKGLVRISSVHAFIVGTEYGIYCEDGNIELNGCGGTLGINVGAREHALYADSGSIYLSGDITCNSTDALKYCVFARKHVLDNAGNYLNLKVTGSSGIIAHTGDVSLHGNVIDVETDNGFAIMANGGYADIAAEKLIAVCSGGHHGEVYFPYGIGADEDVRITVTHTAGIAGRDYGVMSRNGSVSLLGGGYYAIGAMGNDYNGNCIAVCALEGNVDTECDLRLISDKGNGIQGKLVNMNGNAVITASEYGIYAEELYYYGNLKLEADTGIYGKYYIDLYGDDIEIQSTGARSSGIECDALVYLEGNVTIRSSGWHGIHAETDLSLRRGCFVIGGAKNNAQAIDLGGDLHIIVPEVQLMEPGGAYIADNQVFDASGFPAKDVMFCCTVDDISIGLETPVVGLEPVRDPWMIEGLPAGCNTESITWYENSEKMGNSATFRAGCSYYAEILLSANASYRFTAESVAKVNGKQATVYVLNDGTQAKIRVSFGSTPVAISDVVLTVAAPVEGNRPSTGISSPTGSYYGVYSRDVVWLVSSDGYNYEPMAEGAKFEGGKYYRLTMYVNVANLKYAFAVIPTVQGIQPDVTVTVNSGYATILSEYGIDPRITLPVSYDFGLCNDFIIERIEIADVVMPVVGENPRYTANILGTGYRVDVTKNAYYDDYMHDRKLYFLKNGISWWDVTDGGYETVYENDVFQLGHLYRCEIYVCTDSGYQFVMDLYAQPELWPTASVNGETAVLTFSSLSGLEFGHEVACTFACAPKDISAIMLYGLDAPVGGGTPDVNVTAAYPEYYQVQSVIWETWNGDAVGDAFLPGEYYQVKLVITSAQENGGDVAKFLSDIAVYIDAAPVSWPNTVILVDNMVIISCQFYVPAEEQDEKEPVASYLEIRNHPSVLTYQQGEQLVLDGLQVAVIYSNSQEEIISDYTVKGYDPWVVGTQTVCISWNGLTVSYRVTVEIPAYSAILGQPENVVIDSGFTAQFAVHTTADAVSFKWQYRKIYKWFDTTMDGYNTNTLNVAATGARNGYDYRCVVTFADGTVIISDPATLTVYTYITEIQHPNDQTVVLGYKGQFTTSATGESLKYQWQYCRPGSEKWIDTAMEGAARPTVYIESTTARDGYRYRCEITDVAGLVIYTEPATLRVLSFTGHPVDAFAPNGSAATFMVETNVMDGFTYRWQYRKSETANWTDTTMSGYNTNALTVTATLARNGYQYRCVLTGSKNSRIESKPAVLHVGNPVKITAQPMTVRCSAGDTAVFTVVATGVYTYQWQYMSPSMTNWRNTTAEGNQTASIRVAAKSSNNGYRYRCVIQGLDGETYYTEQAILTVH